MFADGSVRLREKVFDKNNYNYKLHHKAGTIFGRTKEMEKKSISDAGYSRRRMI